MAAKRDYYEILGVARDSRKDEIKRSYRKLALQHHPDKGGDQEKFKELSEAYAVLSDDEKRTLYDQYGHAGVDQRFSSEDIFRGADFGDLGRIFEQFFGGNPFGGQRSDPRAGRDLGLQVSVTLEEAYRGVTREIELDRNAPCETCRGQGAEPGSSLSTCRECHGRGQVQRAQRTVFGSFVQVTACHVCGGSGQRVDKPCKTCAGRGALRRRDTLEVAIPAGIDDGDRLRLSGQGELASRGGRPGDLFVDVQVRPHPRFARQGPDLLTALPVDYPALVLGDRATLETLDGDVEVDIPAGSRPGQRLRLKGRGMPHGRGRGDLFLQLDLRIPEKTGRRARELLEELRTTLRDEGDGWFGFRKGKSR